MAAIVIRNLPESVLSALKARAKANKRSAEAEAREILKDAAAETERRRVKLGSELAAIGKLHGGVDLDIQRDTRPIEGADLS